MSKRVQHAVAVVVFLFTANIYGAYSKSQDFRPATAEEKAMTSAPNAPGASAAILDWVRVDDDTNSFSSEYVRVKIFTEEGKKYGDVEITYMPAYPYRGRVTEIDARTIRPDGTIVPFTGKVYDKVVFKVGRTALKAKTFSLPDVQAGSIIEYRFTRRWSDAMLLNTQWSLQSDIPVLHAKLTLQPYDSQGEYQSYFTYLGLPEGKKPVKVGDRYELELTNIPAYQSEAFSLPEQQLKSFVNFYYTSSRIKPAEFWSVESKSWSKRTEDFLGKAGEAKSVAQQLAGSNPTETAKKVYAHVQKLRNYSFEIDKSDQEVRKEALSEARNVAEVLKKGAGFRDEINRTFVAIARAAGLQSEVVRVAPRDETFFAEVIPDAGQMNAEVATVTIDGRVLFLDPGTPHAPFGMLSWEKSGVRGVRASKGPDPQWVEVPQLDPESSTMKRRADLRINGETLDGTIVTTFTGQEALLRRLRTLTGDEETRRKSFEEEAKGWFAEGASVKLKSLTGATSFDEPLVATFDVSLPNLVSSAGSRTLVPMSVFAANNRNPFAPTARVNSIYFQYPRTESDEVKVTIPDSLRVSAVPSGYDLKAGAFGYVSKGTADGNSVTFKRSMFVNVMLVDVKNYNALRSFYGAMLTADQEPLVLVAKE